MVNVRIAYLVLAHECPAHLSRLIEALSSDAASSIFLHIDARSSLAVTSADRRLVNVTPHRLPVYWGDYSIVEATLTLLAEALADPREFDYFVLLSGTHYPLRPAADIRRFFEDHAGTEFIDMAPMGGPDGKPFSRLDIYRARPTDPQVKRAAIGLARILKCPPWRDHRAYLRGLVPYGGCQWWALSRAACTHIDEFSRRETRAVGFFKHTRCPDKSFFHTIIANWPHKTRTAGSLTYTDWSAGGSSPAVLTEKHMELLQTAKATSLFARKFTEQSEGLVAELEKSNQEHEARALS